MKERVFTGYHFSVKNKNLRQNSLKVFTKLGDQLYENIVKLIQIGFALFALKWAPLLFNVCIAKALMMNSVKDIQSQSCRKPLCQLTWQQTAVQHSSSWRVSSQPIVWACWLLGLVGRFSGACWLAPTPPSLHLTLLFPPEVFHTFFSFLLFSQACSVQTDQLKFTETSLHLMAKAAFTSWYSSMSV